ncbi:hypothetical protein HK098_008210 [Nowakowskiella sp. JEL0407]|nr:hypothetical protein HK098_008210 [Nowakowskiella sp. JEL0407]
MSCCPGSDYKPAETFPPPLPTQYSQPTREIAPTNYTPYSPITAAPSLFSPIELAPSRPNRAKKQFPNAKVVVGVDFGTCSFQATIRNLREFILLKIGVVYQPPRTASAKTPTVINYYVHPGETRATHFGWTVDSITKEPHFHRVDRCKLLLHESFTSSVATAVNDNKFFTSETEYRSNEIEKKASIFSGIELPIGLQTVDVISDYLRFMFDVIQQEVTRILRSEGQGDLTMDQYVFCFTVPVFWNLRQQNVMREAVYKARMISNMDSKNLMFCEEPVAGLLCYVNSQDFNLPLPANVLILDAGGGTVDLFQCKILGNRDVAEVTQADGGFFGSTLVDRYFWDFIRETIGTEAYEELWNNPRLRGSKIDFINHWDGIKRGFDENEAAWSDALMGGYKHINLSWELCKVIPEHVMDRFPYKGEIRLEKRHLKSFFDPAVEEILRMVIKQLDQAGKTPFNKLDALVMIGGFCNSPYLRDRVLKHPQIAPRVSKFPKIPEPESAVVQGASWYAFDKGFVSERKSRFTLGLKVIRPFNSFKDRPEDVQNPSDPRSNWKINRGFSKFVEMGQSIPSGSSYSKHVEIFKGASKSTIEILKSIKVDATDVDEEGVNSIGHFKIDVKIWHTTCPNWNKKTFKVNIEFSELELWVKVIPTLSAGKTMTDQELDMVSLTTTLQIDENFLS